MRSLFLAALFATISNGAIAQTMGPHTGPICPDPGPVYLKPTPACGAATLHGGFFKPGRFQRIYQSTGSGCFLREVFLGCA